ncbi:hypothetical protein GQ44DRAFT_729391 [Phaeosphaeriaceae sp. PMI808]|nr:hypothetical protein GQ44DRAFT_729391 [Phaeosphaeriaceae sp. PMI808]
MAFGIVFTITPVVMVVLCMVFLHKLDTLLLLLAKETHTSWPSTQLSSFVAIGTLNITSMSTITPATEQFLVPALPERRSHSFRIPVACEPCRSRKLRCDWAQPCELCKKKSLPYVCKDQPTNSYTGELCINENTKAFVKRLENIVTRPRMIYYTHAVAILSQQQAGVTIAQAQAQSLAALNLGQYACLLESWHRINNACRIIHIQIQPDILVEMPNLLPSGIHTYQGTIRYPLGLWPEGKKENETPQWCYLVQNELRLLEYEVFNLTGGDDIIKPLLPCVRLVISRFDQSVAGKVDNRTQQMFFQITYSCKDAAIQSLTTYGCISAVPGNSYKDSTLVTQGYYSLVKNDTETLIIYRSFGRILVLVAFASAREVPVDNKLDVATVSAAIAYIIDLYDEVAPESPVLEIDIQIMTDIYQRLESYL